MSNARFVTPQSPDITVEAALVAASEQIGGIAEMAHWATAGLAARIRGTGKTLSELTVGELLTMLNDQRHLHHRVFEDGRHG